MSASAEHRQRIAKLSERANRNARVTQDKEALRKPLYKDVEELLTPGFLSHQVTLKGTSLVLRSPSPGDLYLLKWRVPPNASNRVWKEWVIATCIWMVNGQSLLEQTQAPVHLHQRIKQLPISIINILWSVIHGLMNRQSIALSRVEAFCYESNSRVLWRFCGRQSPSREDFTGIPGSSRLGMNPIQRTWMGFNLSEDERLSDTQRWNSAKLVASAQSPKGIKKLNQSDENREKQEMSRRQRVLDKLLYTATGWDDEHDQRIFQPYSADDLVEQMRRWKAGEKDLHDIIVDAWRDRVRNDINDAEEKRLERVAERNRLREEAESHGLKEIVGVSADQIKNLTGFKKRRRKVVEGTSSTMLFDKYVKNESEMGWWGQNGATKQAQTKPLDDRIKSRKIQLHGESPIESDPRRDS